VHPSNGGGMMCRIGIFGAATSQPSVRRCISYAMTIGERGSKHGCGQINL
jgi:hypothetical protein